MVHSVNSLLQPGIPRELNLTRTQRRQVRQRTLRRLLANPRDLLRFYGTTLLPPLMFLAIIGLVVAFGIEWGWMLDPANPRTGLLVALLSGGKFAALPILLVSAFIAHRRYYRPHVYAALRDMNFEVCTSCGYLLRGLDAQTTKCPECGAGQQSPG